MIATATDPDASREALIIRALVAGQTGEPDDGVRYCEQASALAQQQGPLAYSFTLSMEAQARMYAGDPDTARQRLSEAERTGRPVEALWLSWIDTFHGDLAMMSGQPQEALKHYAHSLEAAQARADATQITTDLRSVAGILARLGNDHDALQIAAIADAHELETYGFNAPRRQTLADTERWLATAQERLGAETAEQARATGEATPAGMRVTHACQLVRAASASPVDGLGALDD